MRSAHQSTPFGGSALVVEAFRRPKRETISPVGHVGPCSWFFPRFSRVPNIWKHSPRCSPSAKIEVDPGHGQKLQVRRFQGRRCLADLTAPRHARGRHHGHPSPFLHSRKRALDPFFLPYHLGCTTCKTTSNSLVQRYGQRQHR